MNNDILERFYDLMVKPRMAMGDIVKMCTVTQAVLIVMGSTLLCTLAFDEAIFANNAALIALQLLLAVLAWGVGAAIWHMLASLAGADGSVRELLIGSGFAYFIQILLVPLYLLAAVLPNGMQAAALLAIALIPLWSAALIAIAISAVYQISLKKAVLIMIMPVLILIVLAMLAMIGLGSAIINMFDAVPLLPANF